MSSLEELWELESSQNNVSAKKNFQEIRDQKDANNDNKTSDNEEINNMIYSLLLEVRELRKEQTKRSSVYMIMLGILFALLILYIDRLHLQMKFLRDTR